MITTCANCLNEAIYAYQVTGSYSIKYCSRHTPKFLKTPKYAGRLVKMSDIKVPEVEAKTSKKKPSTPAPAPVVEESPVEEVVEEVVEEAAPEVTEAE
jgi:hypothetical protein